MRDFFGTSDIIIHHILFYINVLDSFSIATHSEMDNEGMLVVGAPVSVMHVKCEYPSNGYC